MDTQTKKSRRDLLERDNGILAVVVGLGPGFAAISGDGRARAGPQPDTGFLDQWPVFNTFLQLQSAEFQFPEVP